MIDKLNIRDDAYNFYLEHYPPKCDQTMYIFIVYGLIKYLIKKMFSAYDIVLPYKLGMFCIRGEKIKPIVTSDGQIRGIAPNWGATRKLWRENPEAEAKRQRIYCFNEHSNGVKYRILWLKRGCIFKNKGVYGFAVAKDTRRSFSKGVREGAEYIVSDKPPAKFTRRAVPRIVNPILPD